MHRSARSLDEPIPENIQDNEQPQDMDESNQGINIDVDVIDNGDLPYRLTAMYQSRKTMDYIFSKYHEVTVRTEIFLTAKNSLQNGQS